MIEIRNLTKIYGTQTVLNIPELKIGKGESFGLVGNNGAGKTTMFRCVLDLIRPNTGTVLSKNNNVASTETWKHYTESYHGSLQPDCGSSRGDNGTGPGNESGYT